MYDIADFKRDVEKRRLAALDRMLQVPVSALVWGPSPLSSDPLAAVRLDLRDTLRRQGFLAEFSEDLYDASISLSNFAQQLAQAEAFDVIFSVPSSHGAIAEIHDFARVPQISNKVIAYVDKEYTNGYSTQSLMSAGSVSTCRVESYDSKNLPKCVVDMAIDQMRRLQEIFYISGRR